MRWARTAEDLSLQNPLFKNAAAELSSVLQKRSKAEVISEDVRVSRRNIRLAWSAIVLLSLMLLATTGTAVVAYQQRNIAVLQRNIAEQRRIEAEKATTNEKRAKANAEERQREAESARQVAVTAQEAERVQRKYAETATVEAKRQRDAAEKATTEANQQRDLAVKREDETRQFAYVTNMKFAYEAQERKDSNRVKELLSTFIPRSDEPNVKDYREFGWYHLWGINHREETTIGTHEAQVISVIFSPDKEAVLSLSRDGQLKIWSQKSPGQSKSIQICGEDVFFPEVHRTNSLAFSPDGKTLACACEGGRIVLLNAKDWGRKIILTQQVARGINAIAFAPPTGKILASALADGVIRLWNTEDGKEVSSFMGHQAGTYNIAYAPDGRNFASVGADGAVKLWDLQTKEAVELGARKPLSSINSVQYSPDGQFLAVAGGQGRIEIFDLLSKQSILKKEWHNEVVEKSLNTINLYAQVITSIAYSSDGKTLAGASEEGVIKLWSLPSGKEIATLKGHDQEINALAFSAGETLLASASSDRTVRLWSAKNWGQLEFLDESDFSIRSMALSPDGKTLASGYTDGKVKLWDMLSGKLRSEIKGHEIRDSTKVMDMYAFVDALAFSPDGETLASGGYDGIVKLWNTKNGEHKATLKTKDYPIKAISYAPDGKTFAMVSTNVIDSSLKIRDATTGKLIKVLEGGLISSIAFSPDGQTLIAGRGIFFSREIEVWSVSDGKKIAELEGHAGKINSVAFSPNGKTMASASDDKTVRLWSDQGQQLFILKGHEYSVDFVTYSSDGKTVASSDGLGTICFWLVENGQLIGKTKGVGPLVFSSDGKLLIAAKQSGEEADSRAIQFFRVATEEEVKRQLR